MSFYFDRLIKLKSLKYLDLSDNIFLSLPNSFRVFQFITYPLYVLDRYKPCCYVILLILMVLSTSL